MNKKILSMNRETLLIIKNYSNRSISTFHLLTRLLAEWTLALSKLNPNISFKIVTYHTENSRSKNSKSHSSSGTWLKGYSNLKKVSKVRMDLSISQLLVIWDRTSQDSLKSNRKVAEKIL